MEVILILAPQLPSASMTSPEAAQGWLDTAKTAENGTPDAMFVIHRSTNDNMVVYKGAVEESGYAGCYPYWIM